MNVWIVAGWDEAPRAVFSSEGAAVAFAQAQDDYRFRPLNEDETGDPHYPFVMEYEVLCPSPPDPSPTANSKETP